MYLSKDDKKLFENKHLRYDITIIPPKIVGIEYNKTFWHYHPKKTNGRYYEEIYQVLYGEAIYLQQSKWEAFLY